MPEGMPTLEEIRKILDDNGISSKVLPSNPQLDWILICEKFNGSKLGVGIATVTRGAQAFENEKIFKIESNVINTLKKNKFDE